MSHRKTSLCRVDDSLRDVMQALQQDMIKDFNEPVSLVDVSEDVARWLQQSRKSFLKGLK